MLPKINRLTKKNDFDKVFRRGKSLAKDFLIFRFSENFLTQSRFGFIVSKKVSTKAVERNLVKRRLRSAVEKNLPTIKTPTDMIIIAMPKSLQKKFNDFSESIAKVFSKISQ